MRPDVRRKLTAEYERLDQRLQDLEKAESRAWGGHRSQIARKRQKAEEELDKLHAVLYPPAIGSCFGADPNAQVENNSFPCRSLDCPEKVDRRTAYDQAGMCDDCWAKSLLVADANSPQPEGNPN